MLQENCYHSVKNKVMYHEPWACTQSVVEHFSSAPSNQIIERTKRQRATQSAALASYHYFLSVRRLLVSQTTHRCRREEEDKHNQPPCPSTTLRRWPRCHRHRTLWILSSHELSVRRQQWCILGTRLRGFVVSSELTAVFKLLVLLLRTT